jgi:hypothetical protein
MKNILVFISLLLGFELLAQNSYNVNLNSSAMSFVVAGTIKDTVSTVGNDTTFDYEVAIDNKVASLNFYDFKVKIKEKAGSSGVCYIKLSGKKFSDDSYTAIASIKYFGSNADTTVYFAQTSTKQVYNLYQVRLSRPASTSKTYIENIKGVIKLQ